MVRKAADEEVGTKIAKSRRLFRRTSLKVDEIWVGHRMRATDPAGVDRLAASMQMEQLKVPITVKASPDLATTGSHIWVLVAGAHRLAAAKQLGWKTIPCEIFAGTETEARIWEIRENLDRTELDALQRAEHIVGLLDLLEQKGISAQAAPKSKVGRPESGVRAAAREIGLERTEVMRAIKVGSITNAAKAAIRAANLSNNQAALLRVAKEANEKAQLEKVAEIAGRGANKRSAHKEGDGDKFLNGAGRGAWQELIALADRRLGKDLPRFLQLIRDTGKPDLIEFAAAVQSWRSSATKDEAREGFPWKQGVLPGSFAD